MWVELTRQGIKTVVVDLDAQGSATYVVEAGIEQQACPGLSSFHEAETQRRSEQ